MCQFEIKVQEEHCFSYFLQGLTQGLSDLSASSYKAISHDPHIWATFIGALCDVPVVFWYGACAYTGRYSDAFYRKQRIDRGYPLHFWPYSMIFHYSFLA